MLGNTDIFPPRYGALCGIDETEVVHQTPPGLGWIMASSSIPVMISVEAEMEW